MYVAFAGLASIITLFVGAYDLKRVNEGVMLGVEREIGNRRGQYLGVEMQDVRDGELRS